MPRVTPLAVAVMLAGCEALLEAPEDPRGRLVTLLQPNALSVPRGREATLAVRVTRASNTTGPITLSVGNVPSGVSATLENQASAGADTVNATLRIRVDTAAALGSYRLKVGGRAPPLADDVVELALEVTPAIWVALSLSRPSLTVIPGGKAPVTVLLQRSNFTGPVTLGMDGPNGISASFATNPVEGTAATLLLTVALDVAPGSYSLTVRSSAAGLPNEAVALALSVTADPIQVVVTSDAASGQGGQASIDIIVNRMGYAGAVTLSLENLPSGVSGSFDPAAPAGDSARLKLVIGALVPEGSYPLTVRGVGTGVPPSTAALRLDVRATSISLGLGPSSLSLLPGTIATSQLQLTRSGFDGPSSISVEGAPLGLTAVPEAPEFSEGAVLLTVTAAPTLTPGDYPLTVRATPVLPAGASARDPPGGRPTLVEANAVLNVQVHPQPPGTGNVTLEGSGCPPDWVAYQDGSGPWIQVLPSSGTFRFWVSSDRGAYAYLKSDSLVVRYATAAELTAESVVFCPPAPPAKTVFANAPMPFNPNERPYLWTLGAGNGLSSVTQLEFAITGVRSGTHDLVGRGTVNLTPGLGGGTRFRILLRRDLDPPDGASLGTLDLGGDTEAFTAATATLSVTGSGTDFLSHAMTYLTTPGCDSAGLYVRPHPTGTLRDTLMSGVPEAQQRPNDFHLLSILALAQDGSTLRTRSVVFHTLENRNRLEPLPPNLPALSVTTLPGTFRRLAVALSEMPPSFSGLLTFNYTGASQTASVRATSAYLGATGTSLGMPDLSGVSGWPVGSAFPANAGGLWSFSAESDPAAPLCTEGRTRTVLTRFGSF